MITLSMVCFRKTTLPSPRSAWQPDGWRLRTFCHEARRQYFFVEGVLLYTHILIPCDGSPPYWTQPRKNQGEAEPLYTSRVFSTAARVFDRPSVTELTLELLFSPNIVRYVAESVAQLLQT